MQQYQQGVRRRGSNAVVHVTRVHTSTYNNLVEITGKLSRESIRRLPSLKADMGKPKSWLHKNYRFELFGRPIARYSDSRNPSIDTIYEDFSVVLLAARKMADTLTSARDDVNKTDAQSRDPTPAVTLAVQSIETSWSMPEPSDHGSSERLTHPMDSKRTHQQMSKAAMVEDLIEVSREAWANSRADAATSQEEFHAADKAYRRLQRSLGRDMDVSARLKRKASEAFDELEGPLFEEWQTQKVYMNAVKMGSTGWEGPEGNTRSSIACMLRQIQFTSRLKEKSRGALKRPKAATRGW